MVSNQQDDGVDAQMVSARWHLAEAMRQLLLLEDFAAVAEIARVLAWEQSFRPLTNLPPGSTRQSSSTLPDA